MGFMKLVVRVWERLLCWWRMDGWDRVKYYRVTGLWPQYLVVRRGHSRDFYLIYGAPTWYGLLSYPWVHRWQVFTAYRLPGPVKKGDVFSDKTFGKVVRAQAGAQLLVWLLTPVLAPVVVGVLMAVADPLVGLFAPLGLVFPVALFCVWRVWFDRVARRWSERRFGVSLSELEAVRVRYVIKGKEWIFRYCDLGVIPFFVWATVEECFRGFVGWVIFGGVFMVVIGSYMSVSPMQKGKVYVRFVDEEEPVSGGGERLSGEADAGVWRYRSVEERTIGEGGFLDRADRAGGA